MDNVKLNVKAIAAMLNISIKELAERAGINPTHLAKVSAGQATMTAKDLMLLADTANISPYLISY